jgi:DNA (cytosine-5)-methyltransferase 1
VAGEDGGVTVVDLFAGPGGWDVAASAHGIEPLGVEWDDAACATRKAAGLRTLQADVSALEPLDFAPCVGLIASPPCQAFSMAGKGEGRGAMDAYRVAIEAMAAGEVVDVAALDEASGDPRGHLVLEPLRWALALRPRWIALEQVPPVLPLWEAMAGVLRAEGYSAATGILSAEQYGVPQTRKRAILLASLDGEVRLPRPTHQRYIAPRSRDDEGGGMFDLPEPGRVVAPEDRDLLPWVSMAQALGWQEGPSPSPSPSVTGGGGSTGGVEVFASKGARARASRAVLVSGQSVAGEGKAERSTDDPSLTVISRFDLCEWKLRAGTNDHDTSRAADEPAPTIRFGARLNDVSWVSNALPNAARRKVDEPAPTITGGHDHNERQWVLRASVSDNGYDKANPRRSDEPAATVTGKHRSAEWVPGDEPTGEHGPCGCPWDMIDAGGFCACCEAHIDDPDGLYAIQGDGTHSLRGCPLSEPPTHYDRLAKGRDVWVSSRPATTVNGDPRISEPGHHDAEVSGSQQANAVRVTLAEALVLQSFPPDYPVQGTKTKQFEQVGNAIPPLLAWHALRAVLPARLEAAA